MTMMETRLLSRKRTESKNSRSTVFDAACAVPLSFENEKSTSKGLPTHPHLRLYAPVDAAPFEILTLPPNYLGAGNYQRN
jgi:hypothetical protein